MQREKILKEKLSDKKIKVLVAKLGLDGHDRGAKTIVRALRDAGMEVIYTGIRQTPEQVVEAAIQEDVDAIGISILSGAHMALIPKVMELLRDKGAADIIVTVGGIIPTDDIIKLKELWCCRGFYTWNTAKGDYRFPKSKCEKTIKYF